MATLSAVPPRAPEESKKLPGLSGEIRGQKPQKFAKRFQGPAPDLFHGDLALAGGSWQVHIRRPISERYAHIYIKNTIYVETIIMNSSILQLLGDLTKS